MSGPDAWPIGGGLAEMDERARLLIAFADGLEEAGFVVSARRMRVVARDAVELVSRVRAYERLESARRERDEAA